MATKTESPRFSYTRWIGVVCGWLLTKIVNAVAATGINPNVLTLDVYKRQAVVVSLLVISVLINYIDRGNLSIAASMIQDELHISHSQLGILLSAFFWSYAAFQLISGWLVDRFNVNWVMAFGFLLWSTATSLTGFAHGLAGLFAVRLLLGVGESVAYPSYSKIFANHLPEHRRGFANSVIAAGVSLGPCLLYTSRCV